MSNSSWAKANDGHALKRAFAFGQVVATLWLGHCPTSGAYAQAPGESCTLCVLCDFGNLCDLSCHCFSLLHLDNASMESTCGAEGVELDWSFGPTLIAFTGHLEYSIDGGTFTPLDQVTASLTEDSPSHGRFMDAAGAGSLRYYRLRRTDENGRVDHSDIHASDCRSKRLELRLDPTGTVHIEAFGNSHHKLVMEVYDVHGALLDRRDWRVANQTSGLTARWRIPPHWPAGWYLCTVSSASHRKSLRLPGGS